MFSSSIFKLAQWVESLEKRIPSMRKMKFAVLTTLLTIAFFMFGIGALFALVISSPAIMGSLLSAVPVGALIWCAVYTWPWHR